MTRAATPRARARTTKMTDREADAVFMPTGQTGSPMTYMLNGKQYIVIAIGGPDYSDELLVYRLAE
jgi:quinoprotein glucose dehydrogenase